MKRNMEHIKEIYPDWRGHVDKGFIGQLKVIPILDYNVPGSDYPELQCEWIIEGDVCQRN